MLGIVSLHLDIVSASQSEVSKNVVCGNSIQSCIKRGVDVQEHHDVATAFEPMNLVMIWSYKEILL